MDIQELKLAYQAAEDAVMAMRRDRNDRVAVAKAAVLAEYAPAMERLNNAVRDARIALEEAVSAAAAHEWEGKRVVRQKRTGGYAKWGTSTYEPEYGTAEVRRLDTVFPDNLASYSKPAIGEPFVRLIKKDGKPGLKIARLHGDWKLADEGEA